VQRETYTLRPRGYRVYVRNDKDHAPGMR